MFSQKYVVALDDEIDDAYQKTDLAADAIVSAAKSVSSGIASIDRIVFAVDLYRTADARLSALLSLRNQRERLSRLNGKVD